MVQLLLTAAAKAAIDECAHDLHTFHGVDSPPLKDILGTISQLDVGDSIDHTDLVQISRHLASRRNHEGDDGGRRWRLDVLLRGTRVFQPKPCPKPDSTSEYKALMKRLREEEERRQYERMLEPSPQSHMLGPKSSNLRHLPGHATGSIGATQASDEADEITYADVNRQMALIMNVLVSIIACSVAIWIAARRWDVPQRLGLSMSGSIVVAVAEVAIYMGYIRRIREAKTKEASMVERKEIVQTWVLDSSSKRPTEKDDVLRYRKGKHR